MKLSVIIPVYNEERTILQLLKKVVAAPLPKNVKLEIVVVDDGSRDKSWKIATSFQKKHAKLDMVVLRQPKNRGKGAAIRTGLSAATGNVLMIQDADLEYDPVQYLALLEPILKRKAHVVYGTRLKTYPLHLVGKHRTPLFTHYLGNKFLTFMTNILYHSNLSDMETCYKVFTRQALHGVTIASNRFEFEPEITAKLLKKKISIVEIPITVSPRGYDDGKKISWKDGFSALWTLVKYRFND